LSSLINRLVNIIPAPHDSSNHLLGSGLLGQGFTGCEKLGRSNERGARRGITRKNIPQAIDG
jgi:hypothetical protein